MATVTSVLVTGASAGIGRTLAEALAGPGVRLHLSGRNRDRLEQVANLCRNRGASAEVRTLDVTDQGAMQDWIGAIGRLDLVIANAGIAAGNHQGEPETPEQTRAVFATNLDGALNTVLPALEVMRSQAVGPDGLRGRIAVIASIAAFVPIPGAAAYCASKATIDRWIVASAPAARDDGIRLCSVCPGFVRTAMTAGHTMPMPGLMDPERAAAIILRGLRTNRVRIVFPWWMGLGARIGGLLPPRLLGTLRRHA